MQNNDGFSTFEKSLKELEQIVAQLEKGDLNLETQLKSFEKGVSLSRECLRQLEEVERKVELLLQADGKIVTKPFEAALSPEGA